MKTFQLPLFIRLHNARRAAVATRRTWEGLNAQLAACLNRDGSCRDGMGLTALKLMNAQNDARRAMWFAEDVLNTLNGITLARQIGSAW